MADFCRYQSRPIALFIAAALICLSNISARSQNLYERPILVVDPGMHTGALHAAARDAEGLTLVTGSDDKTVRIWSAADGKLLRTVRIPVGPGSIGAVHAVAISPDSTIIAAGGYGQGDQVFPIYLIDRNTGKIIRLIEPLPSTIHALAFSSDGRYLAATFYSGGLRVFDRENNWSEAFRDTSYGDESYGVSFSKAGWLATSSFDGMVRHYRPDFKLETATQVSMGRRPFQVAFRPDGNVLAIGYDDTSLVALMDGRTLRLLPGPNVSGLRGGLPVLAWSADGKTLFASGYYTDVAGDRPVFAWDQDGHGSRRALVAKCTASDNSTTALLPLPSGQLVVIKYGPCFSSLNADGTVLWAHRSPLADFREQRRTFSVSDDGTVVDFGFLDHGRSPIRFDIGSRSLSALPPPDNRTTPPKQDGLQIENWVNSDYPTLNGEPIKLDPRESSQSLAVQRDKSRFVIGTQWSLRSFDAQGKRQWINSVLAGTWAVNITGNGRLLIAAHDDGTIRWYRMVDGRELLALQVLEDMKNWVLWTPEGFYDSITGAFGVLNWLVNRGSGSAADVVAANTIPRLRRPDLPPIVLKEGDIVRALGLAEIASTRHDIQTATGAKRPPGARLFLLAVGISEYGEGAAALRLRFAAKDAADVANQIRDTQGGEYNKLGGLYAEVRIQYLWDSLADKTGIFSALDVMERNMEKDGSGQDSAVIFFSGHGAIVEDNFYLLPYGVDLRTPSEIKASSISAGDFQKEISRLAAYGRVLVLIDACHAGAIMADGVTLGSSPDQLHSMLRGSQVTVLTSSGANEPSGEDSKWNNGVFTKVLLDALRSDADLDGDGLISASELTNYVSMHVPALTGGAQHVGIDQTFNYELFVAGK